MTLRREDLEPGEAKWSSETEMQREDHVNRRKGGEDQTM
jgi:hypothetical protein